MVDDNGEEGNDDADDNDTDVAYALVSGGIVTVGDERREAGMAETGAEHPPSYAHNKITLEWGPW